MVTHCNICNLDKDDSAFHLSPSGNRRKQCRPCRAARMQIYYHKTKVLKKRRIDFGELRECGRCHQRKLRHLEFKKRTDSAGVPWDTTCKACRWEITKRSQLKHRDKRLALRKKRFSENPELAIKAKIGWKYGMTIEQYRTMYELQDGKCAICLMPGPYSGRGRLHVDHCHKTKKVRGLLCGFCNHGIGSLREDPARMLKAIEYLQQFT